MITVLAGGQDFEPTGLNYTGSGPSWSRRTVAELLPRIFAKSKKIAFIEWHTGLGPSGELSHLCSFAPGSAPYEDRKSTRLELQSLMRLSYAVFCLKKNILNITNTPQTQSSK